MRIAYFTDTFYPEINGVTNTLSKLSKYLNNNDIEHIFFAPQYSDEESEKEIMRFKGYHIPFSPNSRFALPYNSVIKEKLIEFQPDIVHIVTEFTIGNAGLRAVKEMGIPLVTSYHTNIEQYLEYFHAKILEKPVRAYFKNFHSNAELTLCPSSQTLNQLKSQGFENLDIWSRGVDNELFSPKKRRGVWRKKFGENKFICLYAGRLSFEKGFDFYIDAIKEINKKYADDFVFLFAGDGPYREIIERCNIENIKLTGFLRGEKLAELYADSDLFVFPSGTETFGNVLLEAMASGIPCLCTDSGGVTDFSHHGNNAYVVPFKDSNAIKDGILAVKDNVLLQQRLKEGALKTAGQRSWNSIMEGLMDSYYYVLSKHIKKRA